MNPERKLVITIRNESSSQNTLPNHILSIPEPKLAWKGILENWGIYFFCVLNTEPTIGVSEKRSTSNLTLRVFIEQESQIIHLTDFPKTHKLDQKKKREKKRTFTKSSWAFLGAKHQKATFPFFKMIQRTQCPLNTCVELVQSSIWLFSNQIPIPKPKFCHQAMPCTKGSK